MEKKQKSSGLSRKTRVILALCVIFAGIVLAVTAFWFSMRWLFYENPRLIIREIQLECTTGYWAGKTPQEQAVKAQEFARRIGIVPGETNLFSVNLRNLRESILRDQPEIERVSIRRELPDLLSFEIQSRVPCADTGSGYLLDDKGVALRSAYYAQTGRAGLPLVYSENLQRELTSEGRTADPEIGSALEFIRMIATSEDPCISRISVRRIIVIRNRDGKYLQCEISYRDERNRFRVLLPPGLSGEQLRRAAERLIPALDDALRSPLPPEREKMIDLRFEGSAVVPR